MIYFGLLCLTALSVVITVMTPKFVATSDLISKAATDPSIMATPEALAVIADTSTGLKMMFRYAKVGCRL